MRKTLSGITLAVALATSGYALADQATLTALQNAGVALNAD